MINISSKLLIEARKSLVDILLIGESNSYQFSETYSSGSYIQQWYDVIVWNFGSQALVTTNKTGVQRHRSEKSTKHALLEAYYSTLISMVIIKLNSVMPVGGEMRLMRVTILLEESLNPTWIRLSIPKK